jgi:hypothetical protein
MGKKNAGRTVDKTQAALAKLGIEIMGSAWDEAEIQGLGLNVPGSAGYYCKIPFLVVNFADYQRKAIPAHVNKIADIFDIRAVGSLAISYRDGKLWCYDGRQRQAAMMKKGMTSHRAIIVTGLSYEDEARLFFWLNDVPRKMASWKKFDAQMKAGNMAYRLILKTIQHENNLTTPLHETIEVDNRADVTSTRAVLEAFQEIGIPGLNLVCRVLNEAWRMPPTVVNGRAIIKGGVDPIAKRLDILRGLIAFIKEHREIPDNTIIKVLRSPELSPRHVQAIAKRKKSKGRIDATQYRQAFEEIFIKGRKAA